MSSFKDIERLLGVAQKWMTHTYPPFINRFRCYFKWWCSGHSPFVFSAVQIESPQLEHDISRCFPWLCLTKKSGDKRQIQDESGHSVTSANGYSCPLDHLPLCAQQQLSIELQWCALVCWHLQRIDGTGAVISHGAITTSRVRAT